MSEERKVDASNLKPGMYVSRLDRPWLDSPFPFQGFRLETWEQVGEVQQACEYVYVEERPVETGEPGRPGADTGGIIARPVRKAPRRESGKGILLRSDGYEEPTTGGDWDARLAGELERAPSPPPPVSATLEQEIRTARPLIRDTHKLVRQQMQDVRNGRSLDTVAARECVADITESILRNPDALLCLSGLKKRDEYTYLHSLSVCILSVTLGRDLGLSRSALVELGFGAFLHDIGKMRIPDDVLNKPGRLNTDEMRVMRKHPRYGIDIVDGSDRIPASSRDVIFSHHERLDGSGYTQGVKGSRIHPLTHIVSVCDTYDAIISHRPYKDARAPLDATAVLYRARGRFFEPHLVHQFIRCIGVYPVGSLVALSTNEIGVVIGSNEERMRPKVLVVMDSNGQPLARPREVDLSRMLQTRSGRPLEITRSLETGAYGLHPLEYLSHLDGG